MSNQNALLHLVQTPLAQGITKQFLMESVLLDKIPTVSTNGSKLYEYNALENVDELVTSARNLGETPNAGTIQPVLKQEVLSIYSNDVCVDRAYQHQLGNINNVRAEQTAIATQKFANDVVKDVLYGEGTKGVKGLVPRIKASEGVALSGGLTLDNLYSAVDTVRLSGQGEYMIICNHKTRRAIAELIKAQSGFITTMEFAGQNVEAFDGVPVVPTIHMKDNDVLVINASEQGVHLLTARGIVAEDLGCIDGLYYRTMVEAVFGVAIKNPNSAVYIQPAGRSK